MRRLRKKLEGGAELAVDAGHGARARLPARRAMTRARPQARAAVVGHVGRSPSVRSRCPPRWPSGTYFSARHFLVEQRERTATRQAFTDARAGARQPADLGRAGQRRPRVDLTACRSRDLRPPPRRVVLLVAGQRRAGDDGGRCSRSSQTGSVGVGWTDATDPHAVVVGVPLPAVDAEYYEVVGRRGAGPHAVDPWPRPVDLRRTDHPRGCAARPRGQPPRPGAPGRRDHGRGQGVGRGHDHPPEGDRRSRPGRARRLVQQHGRRTARPDARRTPGSRQTSATSCARR